MDNLSISGTVSFKKECEDRWQTIYSSSLYGTMFSIFGKFKYDEASSTLASAELWLINYKGPIDLGIKEAKFQEHRKFVEMYDELGQVYPKIVRVISLKVVLQGLNEDDYKIINVNCKLSKSDLKKDIYFEIDRTMVCLDDVDGKDSKASVFDSEFCYRDGLRNSEYIDMEYRLAKSLNPTVNMKGEYLDLFGQIIKPNEENEQDTIVNDRSPGAVCPKGYSKIIF